MEKRNGNPVSQWFITFSQWNFDYPDLKIWETLLPKCSYIKATQESHEKNGLHWHIICRLSPPLSKPRLKKFFEDKFPNDWKRIHFDPIRKGVSAHQYVAKECLRQYKRGNWLKLPTELEELRDDWCNPDEEKFREWCREQDRIRTASILRERFEIENPKCAWCKQRIAKCCDYFPDSVS